MNQDNQSGYLVVQKPALRETLSKNGLEVEDNILLLDIVLTSGIIDLEERPGAPTVINEKLKKHFITEHLYAFMDSRNRAEKYLGGFDSEIEFFDSYWELKPVLCVNVPISIEYEQNT